MFGTPVTFGFTCGSTNAPVVLLLLLPSAGMCYISLSFSALTIKHNVCGSIHDRCCSTRGM